MPAGLTATPGNARVTLSWNPVLGASRYNVKRGSTPDSLATISSQAGTMFVDTTVRNLATYYYAVSAVNASAGVESANSPAVGATPVVLPAPSNLTAVPGNAQVSLSWGAVAGASSYWVVRNGSAFNVGAVTAYADSPLVNGFTYGYSVYASPASGGEGARSNFVSAMPVGPPAAPGGPMASASGTQVQLSWSAAPGATSYDVLRSTASGTGYTAVASAIGGTGFTDTSLAVGTTYYYVVDARNQWGTSAYSFETSATTQPAPPAGLLATGGTGTISLSWTAAAKATSYSLYRSSGSGYATFPGSTGLTGTTFVDSGIAAGITYSYFVLAGNAAGTSAPSAVASAMTAPSAPPAVYWWAFSATRILVWWAEAPGATSYTLKRASTPAGPFVNVAVGIANGAGYFDTPLAAGTTYYYSVTALNSSGEGPASPAVAATTIPSAPAGLVWSSPSPNQVTVSWSAVAGATNYSLKRSSVSGGPYTTVGQAINGVVASDTTLTPGTTYYYVTTASNLGGESVNSGEVAAVTRPATPVVSAPSVSSGTIGLSWSAVAGASSYNLKRATVSGGPFATVAAVTTTSYTNTGLTNGVTYYYVVAAANAGGEGPASAQVSGRPVAPAPPSPRPPPPRPPPCRPPAVNCQIP